LDIGGRFTLPEASAPGGSAGFDIIWGDSTAHRFKMNNNNGGADTIVGAATTDTLTNKTLTRPRAGGNNVVTGDFPLSAGWGNTPTKDAVTGTDLAGSLPLTANGAGIAAAPSVTFTFHDGAFPVAAKVIAGRGEVAPPSNDQFIANNPGTTTV